MVICRVGAGEVWSGVGMLASPNPGSVLPPWAMQASPPPPTPPPPPPPPAPTRWVKALRDRKAGHEGRCKHPHPAPHRPRPYAVDQDTYRGRTMPDNCD